MVIGWREQDIFNAVDILRKKHENVPKRTENKKDEKWEERLVKEIINGIGEFLLILFENNKDDIRNTYSGAFDEKDYMDNFFLYGVRNVHKRLVIPIKAIFMNITCQEDIMILDNKYHFREMGMVRAFSEIIIDYGTCSNEIYTLEGDNIILELLFSRFSKEEATINVKFK